MVSLFHYLNKWRFNLKKKKGREFINQVLFTHRYFTSSENLIDSLESKYENQKKIYEENQEEKEIPKKILEDMEEKLKELIEDWIENHFYFFEGNEELIEKFKNFIKKIVSEQSMRDRFLVLMEITSQIKKRSSFRSSKTSVGIVEVIEELLINAKLIQDRRKQFRLYKNCFIAMEAVNLINRKLELKDQNKVLVLFKYLRDSNSISHVSKPYKTFEYEEDLWKFTKVTFLFYSFLLILFFPLFSSFFQPEKFIKKRSDLQQDNSIQSILDIDSGSLFNFSCFIHQNLHS